MVSSSWILVSGNGPRCNRSKRAIVPCTDKRMHHTGNTRCKTHCKTRQPLYLLSFITNAHKFATLGLLRARWARCLSAHRAAVHYKLLTRGEDRLPGPASLHHGGAAAPRIKCEPKAACPPHALPSALALPSAALSASSSAAGARVEGTQPEGSANPNPAAAYSGGS